MIDQTPGRVLSTRRLTVFPLRHFRFCFPEEMNQRAEAYALSMGPCGMIAMNTPGALPSRYGALVAMALYYQGSGIPVIQMNHMHPHPQRGQGWRKRGVVH